MCESIAKHVMLDVHQETKVMQELAPMIGLRTSTMMKIQRNVHLEAKVESE